MKLRIVLSLLLVLSSWSCVLAQVAPLAINTWKAANEQAKPMWAEAESAASAGDHARAAEVYSSIEKVLPRSPQAQRAAFYAASSFDKAGQIHRSLEMLDRAVDTGFTLMTDDFLAEPAAHSRKEKLANRLGTIRFWMKSAWYAKARLCFSHGLQEPGLSAIQYMQLEFPDSTELPELYSIRSNIEGHQESQFVTSENESAALRLEVESAFRTHQHARVLELADSFLAAKPQSGFVPLVLSMKAESLWSTCRQKEGRDLHQIVLDQLKPIAPKCKVARLAEYRVNFLEAALLAKELIRRQKTDATEADWARAHEFCDVVRRRDPEVFHRAEMTMVRAELYYYTGQYEQTVRMADLLIDTFDPILARAEGKKAVQLKCVVMNAHHFAGFALMEMGQTSAAANRFATVVEACKADPDAMHAETPIGAISCYGLWLASARMGNPQGALSAERLMREVWPDSRPARLMYDTVPSLLSPNSN